MVTTVVPPEKAVMPAVMPAVVPAMVPALHHNHRLKGGDNQNKGASRMRTNERQRCIIGQSPCSEFATSSKSRYFPEKEVQTSSFFLEKTARLLEARTLSSRNKYKKKSPIASRVGLNCYKTGTEHRGRVSRDTGWGIMT